jgi:hypothetical protein
MRGMAGHGYTRSDVGMATALAMGIALIWTSVVSAAACRLNRVVNAAY